MESSVVHLDLLDGVAVEFLFAYPCKLCCQIQYQNPSPFALQLHLARAMFFVALHRTVLLAALHHTVHLTALHRTVHLTALHQTVHLTALHCTVPPVALHHTGLITTPWLAP